MKTHVMPVGLICAVFAALLAGCPQGSPPQPDFSATQRSGNVPLTITFQDLTMPGSDAVTSRLWNFGDGGSSQEQNPTHTYTRSGSFTVSLSATSAAGMSTESKPGYIVANDPPAPNFSANVVSGAAPLLVAFEDLSVVGSSPINQWLWDFGDGATSSAQDPSHTYTSGGVYTVSLTVKTVTGDATETKNNYITVTSPPSADFRAAPTSGIAPLAVAFTDLSTDGGTDITSWSWVFGDGGTSTAQNPSHTYTAAGLYTVSLTVTNAFGTDTKTSTGFISVTEAPVPPEANFTAFPGIGPAPLTVQFTDTSDPGNRTIVSWLWDFGDGVTSTQQNPSHTYTTAGDYTVALTVTTSAGTSTRTRSDFIFVE